MLKHPYLLFVGNAADQLAAKTALGVLQWRPDWCIGQVRFPGCRATLSLPDMTPEEAAEAGAGTLIVGVANAGGFISPDWIDVLARSLTAGLDLASGLHERLTDIPRLRELADHHGRGLFDVRHPRQAFPVGTGEPRPGKRLLTVGTDCSIGKMYTALALARAMRERGIDADFRATGQTGIFIAGSGVPVDAVVADFISGSVEWISPARNDNGWDLIEGQGSLFHASFAGVSLGLLHGAQPDALVLCHEPGRAHMRGLAHYPLPDLRTCLEANLQAARLTNPGVVAVGVAVNTSRLTPADAATACAQIEDLLGLPCQDPVTMGVGRIADRLQACFAN